MHFERQAFFSHVLVCTVTSIRLCLRHIKRDFNEKIYYLVNYKTFKTTRKNSHQRERFISIHLTLLTFNFTGLNHSVTQAYVNNYDIIFEETKSIVIKQEKNETSCYQKLRIGGGCCSPEKISPKKFHKV